MKYLMVKYQFAGFKDIGREMARASRSDNIEVPLLFRFHHQHYIKKHTFLVCVLYSLNELGMPKGWGVSDPAVVWTMKFYDSLIENSI